MSVEASVYTSQRAISGTQMKDLAREKGLEIRFLDLAGAPLPKKEDFSKPLQGKSYIVIAWLSKSKKTTTAVDSALAKADKETIDQLGISNKIGWFEFGCRKFNYDRFWKKFPDEKDEFEESIKPSDLKQMKKAQLQYLFRCGTEPDLCGDMLCQVAKLLRDETEGFME